MKDDDAEPYLVRSWPECERVTGIPRSTFQALMKPNPETGEPGKLPTPRYLGRIPTWKRKELFEALDRLLDEEKARLSDPVAQAAFQEKFNIRKRKPKIVPSNVHLADLQYQWIGDVSVADLWRMFIEWAGFKLGGYPDELNNLQLADELAFLRLEDLREFHDHPDAAKPVEAMLLAHGRQRDY